MSDATHKLRSISYVNEQWVVVSEPRPALKTQVVAADDDGFPFDRVTKLQESGKKIVHVCFGDKTWVVVLEVTHEESDKGQEVSQSIVLSAKFPEDEIAAAWKKAERIAVLQFCNDKWVLVTEKIAGLDVGQSLITTSDELPSADVKNIWDDGKRVSSLSWGGGQWVLIAEPKGKYAGQSYTANTDYPSEKIKEKYAGGFGISSIAYNAKDNVWAAVFDGDISGQRIVRENTFPEERLKTEMGVIRYGKRFY